MVPICDMLNHKHPPQTEWTFENTTKDFILISNENIPRGKPVTNSYGDLGNYILYYN